MIAARLSGRPRPSGFRGQFDGDGGRRAVACLFLFGLGLCCSAAAADLEELDARFRAGDYDGCARMAGEEVAKGAWTDLWYRYKIESELARGKYADALASLEGALRRFPASVPLRLL